jgi:hypothetical protein
MQNGTQADFDLLNAITAEEVSKPIIPDMTEEFDYDNEVFWEAVAEGNYDYDPSPYDGTYSEM